VESNLSRCVQRPNAKNIMPTELEISQHRQVQIAAKSALARLENLITAEDTEKVSQRKHMNY